MKQQFPIEVQMQLIDTLCEVFYYKDPLYRFLLGMSIPRPILNECRELLLVQRESKRYALNILVESLMALPDNQGLGPLRQMLQSLTRWSSFAASADVSAAKKSVETLTRLVETYDRETQKTQENEQQAEQRQKEWLRQQENASRLKRQEDLRDRYFQLIGSDDPQQRGHEFETLLHDMFEFEGLNPEGSFTVPGEQIDGALELDGTHYLVEAKWIKGKVEPAQVSWFKEKVERRYRATAGLMIAVNDFTDEAIRTARDSKCVVLMNGDDLYHVLQPTVDLDLKELLRKKIAAFSRQGTPFITARKILNSG